MDAFLKQVLQMVLSYILVLAIGYGLINFLTNGFITQYIKVKASRGKKVLVEVHAVGDIYYKTGFINESLLEYKDRKKQKKSILVSHDCVFYKSGLKVLFVDEVKNAVLRPDFSAVAGFDAVKLDNLIVRALTNPSLQEKFLKIILIVTIITIFLVLANTALLVTMKKELSSQHALLQMMLNSTRNI